MTLATGRSVTDGSLPPRPPADFGPPWVVQFRGLAWARRLLRLFGWRVCFEGLPARQGVLVVYPHTSNWDFVVLVLVKWAIGIPVFFWGKDSLFRVPLLGRWLRALGGIPVDRHAPQGMVGQVTQHLRAAVAEDRYFWLALAPEGTRSLTPGWRSGFYQACSSAGVPLGLVRLDFARREVLALDFIRLGGDPTLDMPRIAGFYDGVRGRVATQASPIRLRAPRGADSGRST
jgi:1-acyl-sn-glycerol-3-phosphate acyltransferase